MCSECDRIAAIPTAAPTPHWVAERNPDGKEPYVWSPALDFGEVHGASGLGCSWLFFESKEQCESWLRDNLGGVPIPVGEPEGLSRQREDYKAEARVRLAAESA